jgi:predicted aminopeptidase
MKDFFISYSRKDNAMAEALASAIEKHGISIWRDKDNLLPGDNFTKKIPEALNAVKALIFLSSVNSADSEWANAELTAANEQK